MDRLRFAWEQPWFLDAACRDVPKRVFYPAENDTYAAEAAKAVCGMCDVRAECLDLALVNRERYGVWGGLTETERRRVARKRRDRLRKVAVA